MGLTYLSRTKLDFSATPTLTKVTRPGLAAILSSTTIDMTMREPQQVLLSGYHELTDRLALMADLGYENWQDFGKIDVGVYSRLTTTSAETTFNAHYQNTWHVALGAQYKLFEDLKMSCGAAYDSSVVNGANRTPTMPVGAMWRFAGGAQYTMSETMTLTGGYTYVWSGDLAMDIERGPLAGRVAGEFNNLCIRVLTLALDWKF